MKKNGWKGFCKKLYKYRVFLLMLAPAVIYTLIFCYYPMTGIVMAFKKYSYAGGIWGSPVSYTHLSNGYMATGWKAIGGKGCYFDDQGVYQPDRNGSMMVALTFDDGPGVYTSTLLDTLEQYGAQATFFMLGSNVEKYGADVIPRMAAIGCELGNHSYAHPNMKELSTDDGLAQFQMTDDLIAQYNNGQGATVIRFPYGNSTDELLASIGRPSIMWDVDTLDWQTKNVQANISAVLDSVSPGDIILMHDIHETTVESCATIVPELINRGYELVTIHTLAAANGVDLAAGETYYGFHGGTTNE